MGDNPDISRQRRIIMSLVVEPEPAQKLWGGSAALDSELYDISVVYTESAFI